MQQPNDGANADGSQGGQEAQNAQNSQDPQSRQIDPQKIENYLKNARSEQNIILGALAGFLAALVCAVAWAAITAATGWRIGLVAIFVGMGVGIAVQKAGKGLDTIFGIVGAVLSFFAIFAGNLLTHCWNTAVAEHTNVVFIVLWVLAHPAVIVEDVMQSFNLFDVVFYLIGVYEGYKFSFRTITQEEIEQLSR